MPSSYHYKRYMPHAWTPDTDAALLGIIMPYDLLFMSEGRGKRYLRYLKSTTRMLWMVCKCVFKLPGQLKSLPHTSHWNRRLKGLCISMWRRMLCLVEYVFRQMGHVLSARAAARNAEPSAEEGDCSCRRYELYLLRKSSTLVIWSLAPPLPAPGVCWRGRGKEGR